MKIVKEAGGQPTPRLHHRIGAELRPILAVTGAGTALLAGSRILLRRGWTLLGQHLDGWERYGTLVFGGYIAVYAARHAPHTARFAVPAAVVAWCVAAWWVAPPPAGAEPVEETDEEPEDELTLDELASLVRRIAAHRQGAHLADLLQTPELTSWTQPELKATAVDLGLPVEEFKLIFSGRQRVRDGIRLRDLPHAPAPAAPTAPPPGAPADPAPQPLSSPSHGPE